MSQFTYFPHASAMLDGRISKDRAVEVEGKLNGFFGAVGEQSDGDVAEL